MHEYHFQVSPDELGLNGSFTHDIVVDASLDKTSNQFLLRSRIKANGAFECDRCLTMFDRTLESSYQMCYVTEGVNQQAIDPAEIQVIPSGLTVIDVSEDVRQTILLSVPLKLLCSNGCAGLCPHCGANLNIDRCTCSEQSGDPRWEGLAILKNKNLND